MKIVGSPPESFARWCAGCVWDERPSYNPTYLWPTLPVAVREAWGLLDSDETRSVLDKALAEVAELRSQLEMVKFERSSLYNQGLRLQDEVARLEALTDAGGAGERLRHVEAKCEELRAANAKLSSEAFAYNIRISNLTQELDAARRRPFPPGEYEITPNGTLAALRKDLAAAVRQRDQLARSADGYASKLVEAQRKITNAATALGSP